MINVACTHEEFKNKEILDISFVRSQQNLADGLTNTMSQAKLFNPITTSKTDHDVKQWIVREN